MKLLLPLAVAWTLCSTAAALQCIAVRGSRVCAAGEQCASAAIHGNVQLKFCLSSEFCNPNNQTFSMNLGFVNFTATLHCCNTDNCNSRDVPYPDAPTKNDLQCFSCEGVNGACDRKVQCVGGQDRCISAAVVVGNTTRSVSGCVSRNLCGDQLNLDFLGPAKTNYTKAPKCCDTKLCNSAGPLALSVVPLLLGLITLLGF